MVWAAASAESVARYFLYLAGCGDEAAPLTHMHLHKLLYYAQGWSLGMRDRPLFEAELEAWKYGPVVADLYRVFIGFGEGAIPFSEGRAGEDLSPEDRSLIESVWRKQRGRSAIALMRATHREPPWREARRGLSADDRSNQRISRDSMARQFGDMVRWCRDQGFDPDQFWRSLEQARRGEVLAINLAAPPACP